MPCLTGWKTTNSFSTTIAHHAGPTGNVSVVSSSCTRRPWISGHIWWDRWLLLPWWSSGMWTSSISGKCWFFYGIRTLNLTTMKTRLWQIKNKYSKINFIMRRVKVIGSCAKQFASGDWNLVWHCSLLGWELFLHWECRIFNQEMFLPRAICYSRARTYLHPDMHVLAIVWDVQEYWQ